MIDLHSQSLDWWRTSTLSTNHVADINKTKNNYYQEQHKNPKQMVKKTTKYTTTKAKRNLIT